MSASVKIPFKGSSFKMNTGVGSGGFTITGITKANPGVVTFSGMAPSAGTVVDISGVLGMTEVNGNAFVVNNPTGSTFELSGIDTTNYAAYTSGGAGTEQVFSAICEIKTINHQGGTTTPIDASTICSDVKEFVYGLADTGTLQLDMNFAPNTVAQLALDAAQVSGALKSFMIVLPGARGTVILFGFVQTVSFQGAVEGVWTSAVTIKLSGKQYVLAS